jgi:hypothetical protein
MAVIATPPKQIRNINTTKSQLKLATVPPMTTEKKMAIIM